MMEMETGEKSPFPPEGKLQNTKLCHEDYFCVSAAEGGGGKHLRTSRVLLTAARGEAAEDGTMAEMRNA